MRILIVEDERQLADALAVILEKNSYTVDTAYDGETGLYNALSNIYDAVILDVMLPKMNGFQILGEMRKQKVTVPVLMLTAKSEAEDIINGLDTGADDYLTKPFVTEVLLARLRAITRRSLNLSENNPSFADLTLKPLTCELWCGDSSIKLGAKEFQILELLVRNPGQIVPKERITEKIWGFDNAGEYNNVEVYISFVRKKLNTLGSSARIVTTRGVGYSLEDSP